MKEHPLRRRVATALHRMSPLQREITAGLLTGEDDWYDEGLAERHGTTSGAVRIERSQARRLLQEALSESFRLW
jgi:DNA-directed RNA polymerase specialized sigma24 family protein